jgi:hypothetical protein
MNAQWFADSIGGLINLVNQIFYWAQNHYWTAGALMIVYFAIDFQKKFETSSAFIGLQK